MKNSVVNTNGAPVETSTDGRRQRSERSRHAIIKASLDLIEEGVLVPTAQQISERAGVGIRSFFRHFADMESLFEAVDAQGREHVKALFVGGDREGSMGDRILHAVERRAAGYEDQKNIILTTAAQSWRYELLRKRYAHYQKNLRKDLQDWLPEIKTLGAAEREAVDAVASAEMWLRLRKQQGLSKKQSIAVVVSLLGRLMVP